MYETVALNCFRYLDFKSFDEVDRLTVHEYRLLMKAVELKAVDEAYIVHLQAFKNFEVRAMRKVGKNKQKPVFDRFEKFFDYKKHVKKALGIEHKIEDPKLSGYREFLISKRKKEGEGNG